MEVKTSQRQTGGKACKYKVETDVHSLNAIFVASHGLDLPEYFEIITVDTVPIFYYDTNMKSAVPAPEWMDSTTGQRYSRNMNSRAHYNKYKTVQGLNLANQQFNLTGASTGINIYQSNGRCELHSDGTVKGFLIHAFNGKDFFSLDVENKAFIATVPQAVLYKMLREKDPADLEYLVSFYKSRCTEEIKMHLQHDPRLRVKKAPEVRAFKKKTEVICHVTGFFPRTVQVQWFESDMQPVVEGVIEGEVLPNGDGTYQTRKSVVIPAEHTGIYHYSCVVQHSSIPGNITETWGKIVL
ncbi:class I histocompatibility antigen, F10 alpha chain-like [Chanos chanos]|uniref:Class I histocompatibility antigen, F10 alpha chain-like n=1 Tax=Chanos chanos TaxID=29144 RepID=A0A6J2WI36_CHACN|nr:class I histocompatibility antigen, F10 alpha chain-like [Chanos chanos]